MTDTTQTFDMNAAPMHVGTVRMKVRDLDRVAAFYEDALGLTRLGSDCRAPRTTS